MRHCRCVAFAVILVAVQVRADDVFLKDTSKVHGSVTAIKDGVVIMKTDFAGELKIPLDKVLGVTTDAEQTLTLKSGGVFMGRMDFSSGQQQILQKEGAAPVDVTTFAMAAPVPPEGSGPPPPDWKGRAELGLNGSFGNSDQVNGLAGVTANRVTIKDRLTLSLRAQYQESESERTKNEVVGGARYERDISPRAFAFTRLELEYDEFENLDLRSSLAGGFGYFVVRKPQQEFKIRAGVAVQNELFGDGTSDTKPLAELGYDYRLDVKRWFRYNSTFTYFVDPGNVDDWRLTAENAAEFPLSNTTGWKLRLGVRNQYDAEPLPGIEGLDTSYYLSLVYAWN